jgi:hypothetical protein
MAEKLTIQWPKENGQIMICKKILLYGKLKIEQHDPDNNKNTGGEFMCSGMVSSSCSTCDPVV